MRLALALAVLALAPAAAPAKTLITYQRSGGFAAIPLALTVGAHGKCNRVSGRGTDPQAFTLGSKKLKALKGLIAKADFATLEADYRPTTGTVADGFTETVRYGGKTVVAGTGGDAPARLTKLLSRLSTLASSGQ